MPASLREEKKQRTLQAIAAAALDLFTEHGYGPVTLAQVAATAGVGERTVYRYFADKEELLFAEDAAWQAGLRAALAGRPAGEAPLDALEAASAAVTAQLEDRRDEVRRRFAVIAAAPALQARERAKHAAWEEVLAAGLRDRGVPAPRARLLARPVVACFDEAVARWLAADRPRRSLAAELRATLTELRTALAP